MKKKLLLFNLLLIHFASASERESAVPTPTAPTEKVVPAFSREAFLKSIGEKGRTTLAEIKRNQRLVAETPSTPIATPSHSTFPRSPVEITSLRKSRLQDKETVITPNVKEELMAVVEDILKDGPQATALEGSPQERLFQALINFNRELIFLKIGLHDTAPSTSNQFCPLHGNLEESSLCILHQCKAQWPKNKVSLKKITNTKQLTDWVEKSSNLEIRQKREIIAQTLRTLGFDSKTKELLEGIFEFTWHCSIKKQR